MRAGRWRLLAFLLLALGAAAILLPRILPFGDLPRRRAAAASREAERLAGTGRLAAALERSDRALALLAPLCEAAGSGGAAAPEACGDYAEACRARSRIERRRGNLAGEVLWLARSAGAETDPARRAATDLAWGQGLLRAGRPAEAIAPLERARAADPATARTGLLLAEALHRAGRSGEAVRIAEGILASPEAGEAEVRAGAEFLLGWMARDRGDAEAMRRHVAAALASDPNVSARLWIPRP